MTFFLIEVLFFAPEFSCEARKKHLKLAIFSFDHCPLCIDKTENIWLAGGSIPFLASGGGKEVQSLFPKQRWSRATLVPRQSRKVPAFASICTCKQYLIPLFKSPGVVKIPPRSEGCNVLKNQLT